MGLIPTAGRQTPNLADGGELGRWSPLSVPQVAALFAGAGVPWWVAGGWAIDLFVGRQTREHEDIEIVVLRRDYLAAQAVLEGWEHYAAAAGRLRPLAPGEPLPPEVDNTWCRPAPDAPWALQILIEEARGDRWVYRRDSRIEAPLAQFGRCSADGVPYVAPETQLLYKAKGSRPKDEADLTVALPLLEPQARNWLRSALSTWAPDHPWLARLDQYPSGR